MSSKITQKVFAKYRKPMITSPNLLEGQVKSYKWLFEKGIGEVFKEFSPINDYSNKKFQMEFTSFSIGESEHDEYYAKENKLTYEVSLKVNIKLFNKTLGVTKEQEFFFTDIPLMTTHGTFIINGVERVVVPQLARSFGVFFTEEENKGKKYFGAKLIPARGIWIELESDPDGVMYARVDKKRKFPVTSLLRAMGLKTDEKILKTFEGNDAVI